MTVAVTKFIAVVSVVFPRPKMDETTEAAWVALMVRSLRGYDAETLSEAAHEIITTRVPAKDGRWFPAPAEVIAACNRVAAKRAADATPLLTTGRRDASPYAGWRSDVADDLVRSSPMAAEAARGGWIGALHDWCRRHLSLPRTRQEIDTVRSDAEAFAASLEVCRRGEGGAANDALLRLGQTMQARRSDLASRVGEP